MKIIIERSDDCVETQVKVLCSTQKDDMTEELIQRIQDFAVVLKGWKEKCVYNVRQDEIFYIECVDDKTFLYCEEDIYESTLKIYQLEERLKNTSFVRVSKSVILNCNQLSSVRPLLNAKIEAELINGEKVLINRHYVAAFRKKFGL